MFDVGIGGDVCIYFMNWVLGILLHENELTDRIRLLTTSLFQYHNPATLRNKR